MHQSKLTTTPAPPPPPTQGYRWGLDLHSKQNLTNAPPCGENLYDKEQELPHPLGQLKMFPNVRCFPFKNENFTKQLSSHLMSLCCCLIFLIA